MRPAGPTSGRMSGRLANLAVQPGGELEVVGVELGLDPGPEGARGVEPLRAGPLAVLRLEVAQRGVVRARVAEDRPRPSSGVGGAPAGRPRPPARPRSRPVADRRYTIGSPGPTTAVEGLRNVSGSSGTSPPSPWRGRRSSCRPRRPWRAAPARAGERRRGGPPRRSGWVARRRCPAACGSFRLELEPPVAMRSPNRKPKRLMDGEATARLAQVRSGRAARCGTPPAREPRGRPGSRRAIRRAPHRPGDRRQTSAVGVVPGAAWTPRTSSRPFARSIAGSTSATNRSPSSTGIV